MNWRRRPNLELARPPLQRPAARPMAIRRSLSYKAGPRAEAWPRLAHWRKKLDPAPAAEPVVEPVYWPSYAGGTTAYNWPAVTEGTSTTGSSYRYG